MISAREETFNLLAHMSTSLTSKDMYMEKSIVVEDRRGIFVRKLRESLYDLIQEIVQDIRLCQGEPKLLKKQI